MLSWIRKLKLPGFLRAARVLSSLLVLLPGALLGGLPAPEPDGDRAETRLYTTSAERREAGLRHTLTPWLSLTTLLELEAEDQKRSFRNGDSDSNGLEFDATLQLGLVATPWESVKAEMVVEYDTDDKKLFADEALLGFELDDWELELGKLYTPFGSYISHFAQGPILELGETRVEGATLSYAMSERLDLAMALYAENARESVSGRRLGWAVGLEGWPGERLKAGLSYQSNLADADAGLLEETEDRYEHPVPGLSGYLVWSANSYQVSLEALGALRSFGELAPDRDRPLAGNLEFVHFLGNGLEWAVRLEASREVEDEPGLQYGLSLTWRLGLYSSFSMEYLHGRFEQGLATDEEDRSYDRIDRIGIQFSLSL